MDASPILHPAAELEPAAAQSADLSSAIAAFLAQRRRAECSAETLALYTRQLTAWVLWRGLCGYGPLLADITIDELRAYVDYLQTDHAPHQGNTRRPASTKTRLAPATVASIWRTIRAAWNFWIDEQLLSDAQATFFLRKRIPAPKVANQIRQTYDGLAFVALLNAADQGRGVEQPLRDRAILLLLYDTGMRVSELCSLSDADMNYTERQAVVTGKGNKQRYVFWTARTTAALLAYLAVRSGEPGGPLFRGHGSKNSGGKLKADGVRGIIDRLAKRAGIRRVDGAPGHAIRHTFAHRFLDNGGDGLHLQQLMGHESIETTQRYVRENPTGLRRTYRRIIGEE